jgi:hypothetical protein
MIRCFKQGPKKHLPLMGAGQACRHAMSTKPIHPLLYVHSLLWMQQG